MIESKSIRLRAWSDKDLATLSYLRNNVEIQIQLMARVRGSSIEQVRGWLENYTDKPDRFILIIADKGTDECKGFIQITNMNFIDRHAEIGICLHEESRGQGLCGSAISLVSNYLKEQWNVQKIILKVLDDNLSALKCYEKSGFERCGLYRKHIFIKGQWCDVLIMENFI